MIKVLEEAITKILRLHALERAVRTIERFPHCGFHAGRGIAAADGAFLEWLEGKKLPVEALRWASAKTA